MSLYWCVCRLLRQSKKLIVLAQGRACWHTEGSLAGLVTPPDSFGASVLPVAIAALWIFIFVDLLKAAVPQDDFDF